MTIAISLQYLQCKDIEKFIFFWLFIVSLWRKKKHESDFFFQILQNFESGHLRGNFPRETVKS